MITSILNSATRVTNIFLHSGVFYTVVFFCSVVFLHTGVSCTVLFFCSVVFMHIGVFLHNAIFLQCSFSAQCYFSTVFFCTVLFFCCVCFLRYLFFCKINLVFPYFDVTCTVYHIVSNKISIFYLQKKKKQST